MLLYSRLNLFNRAIDVNDIVNVPFVINRNCVDSAYATATLSTGIEFNTIANDVFCLKCQRMHYESSPKIANQSAIRNQQSAIFPQFPIRTSPLVAVPE